MGEDILLSFEQRNTPYLQGQRRKKEEWVLEPTESETGQLVVVQVAEQWLAAAAAARSSVHPSFLNVPFCCLLPIPIHRAAAAGNGIVEVGFLLV